MVERLMIRHLPDTVGYGEIKQVNVYSESDIVVEITKDSELVYGSEMKKG